MPKFEPSFAIKSLRQVSPGALVIFQQAAAFVCIDRSAQHGSQGEPALAVYDVEQLKFVLRYFDAGRLDVLLPGGELIIKPDLHTLTANVSVQEASEKLFQGDDTYIAVEVPATAEVSLLSLTTGAFVRPTVTSMRAFDSWQIGVMSMGDFVPLLNI